MPTPPTPPTPPARPRRPLAGHRSRARAQAGPRPHQQPPPRPSERRPEPAPPERQRDPRPLSASLPMLVATLVVVALAATAGLLVARARAEERLERARSSALAAAEAHAVTVLSYDYRRLDRDFARARAVLTGRFADDYARTTQRVVRPTAEQVKAVVTAEVAASSVVRAPSADRVVVLLFVDQTTTSTRLDGPKVDLNRVRMTVSRVGEEWRVSGIDAL